MHPELDTVIARYQSISYNSDMKISLSQNIRIKKQPLNNASAQVLYLVCYNNETFQDKPLMVFTTLEESLTFANQFNKNEELTNEFDKVHVERHVITKELIQIKWSGQYHFLFLIQLQDLIVLHGKWSSPPQELFSA